MGLDRVWNIPGDLVDLRNCIDPFLIPIKWSYHQYDDTIIIFNVYKKQDDEPAFLVIRNG